MNHSDFIHWLSGFVDLNGAPPTPKQWEVIVEHLNLCFNKVTTKSVQPPKSLFDTIAGGTVGRTEPTYCSATSERACGGNPTMKSLYAFVPESVIDPKMIVHTC